MSFHTFSRQDRDAVDRAAARARFSARVALLTSAAALALALSPPTGLVLADAAAAQTWSAQSAGPASFADLVQRVKPAVVAIRTKMETRLELPDISPDDPFYRFFKRFGPYGRGDKHVTMAQGSGFFISADGYVVTNNHVVENATEVELTLDDGRKLPAKIVGTDKRTDLALLKVKDSNSLPYVEWAQAPPRVGDWVVAVGNPFGLGGTVTAGIVSARGRDIGAGPYDDFLQIDAPVNRGNSGGPSFDAQGRVVGVNAAIYSPTGGSIGIGFAIPAEVAKDVIAQLKDKGSVARGWIGVHVQTITKEIAEGMGLKSTKGALVAQPQKGGPADQAGLKAGDVITAVDGEKVGGPRDLARRIASFGPGKTVDLTYLRDGAEKSVKLTLSPMPKEQEPLFEEEPGGHGAAPSGFGLELAPASEAAGHGAEGVVVTDIDPMGAAAQGGLRQGDVILEAGGQPLKTPADFTAAIAAARKDERKSIVLRVRSAEGTRFVALFLSPAS